MIWWMRLTEGTFSGSQLVRASFQGHEIHCSPTGSGKIILSSFSCAQDFSIAMLLTSVATAGNQTASQRPWHAKCEVMVDSRPPVTDTWHGKFLAYRYAVTAPDAGFPPTVKGCAAMREVCGFESNRRHLSSTCIAAPGPTACARHGVCEYQRRQAFHLPEGSTSKRASHEPAT